MENITANKADITLFKKMGRDSIAKALASSKVERSRCFFSRISKIYFDAFFSFSDPLIKVISNPKGSKAVNPTVSPDNIPEKITIAKLMSQFYKSLLVS